VRDESRASTMEALVVMVTKPRFSPPNHVRIRHYSGAIDRGVPNQENTYRQDLGGRREVIAACGGTCHDHQTRKSVMAAELVAAGSALSV